MPILKVIIDVFAPPEVNVTDKFSNCADMTKEGLKCDDVKLGEVVGAFPIRLFFSALFVSFHPQQ